VGTPVGTTNVQIIFDDCQRVLKLAVAYRSLSLTCSGLQLLKAVFNLAEEILHIVSQKGLNGMKSGDTGGQATVAPLSPGIVFLR
jgi:hypothetical protein